MIARILNESAKVRKDAKAFFSKFTFEPEFRRRFFPLSDSTILTDGQGGTYFQVDDADGGDIVAALKENGVKGSGRNVIVFLSFAGEGDKLLLTDAAPTCVYHALEDDTTGGSEAGEASRYARELITELSKKDVVSILNKMERLHDRWDKR